MVSSPARPGILGSPIMKSTTKYAGHCSTSKAILLNRKCRCFENKNQNESAAIATLNAIVALMNAPAAMSALSSWGRVKPDWWAAFENWPMVTSGPIKTIKAKTASQFFMPYNGCFFASSNEICFHCLAMSIHPLFRVSSSLKSTYF